MPGIWSFLFSVLFPISFCLSLQEFFFTPFAARGRVFLKMGREGNISETPKNPQPRLKGPDCLSTQDCPQDQKERGKTGADLNCSRCVCAGGQGIGVPRIHMVKCVGICYLSVHQALFSNPCLGKQGALQWRPEEVPFPVLSLQLEMVAC